MNGNNNNNNNKRDNNVCSFHKETRDQIEEIRRWKAADYERFKNMEDNQAKVVGKLKHVVDKVDTLSTYINSINLNMATTYVQKTECESINNTLYNKHDRSSNEINELRKLIQDKDSAMLIRIQQVVEKNNINNIATMLKLAGLTIGGGSLIASIVFGLLSILI